MENFKKMIEEQDQALRNSVEDAKKKISLLKQIMENTESEDEKQVLTECIDQYQQRIRRDKALLEPFQFDDYRPKTIGQLMKMIGEIKNPEGKVIMAEDDGMGYCATGFRESFCAYQDENGNIQFWV